MDALAYDRLFVLTDDTTRRLCYPLLEKLPALQAGRLISIRPGDMHKDMRQVATVWQILSDEGASRHSLLLNLGGGMVTDLGGFAGATFKRGLHTFNIPTTLMASVDAAVGGKTGVNFNGLKNEVGSFYSPDCVLISGEFLRTLDYDNLLSGYAEMLKHALISGGELYGRTLGFDLGANAMDYVALNRLVGESVAVKEGIVSADPQEQGLRKALNFGHTVGHAVESFSFQQDRPLLHGLAVAVGLACELYLSYRLCGFPQAELQRLVGFLKTYYHRTALPCEASEALYELMTHDKKNEGGRINFTLLAGLGQVRLDQSASKEQIFEALDFYRDTFF